MAQVFQRIDPLSSKPLNYPQAVKNWSNEDLVDLNLRDFEILVACIRARMECLQES
jgi:hypothetical protein